MKKNIENKIKQIILPYLKNGRSAFDLNHTKAVVYWMKKILKEYPHLDNNVLIIASYAHDWGYVGLFANTDSSNIKEIYKQKELHMKLGAKKIRELLLREFSLNFSTSQIDKIAHLVSVHDKIEELRTEEEITLMEADTLGMLDISRVKPTFTKEDNDHFISTQIYQRRLPKFVHPDISIIATKLARRRIKFYQ